MATTIIITAALALMVATISATAGTGIANRLSIRVHCPVRTSLDHWWLCLLLRIVCVAVLLIVVAAKKKGSSNNLICINSSPIVALVAHLYSW